ncbi:MAG TPA: ABC transporter permease [Gemmatimonadales bacterium]|nr:ABC transporter permease [Gemmatimonadales bacterium]
MHSAFALVRASWRSASSYRLRLILSFGALLVSVVPLYFIAGALQQTMAASIEAEGGQYFGFLIVGSIAFMLVSYAVSALGSEIGSGINTGVLDALLGTPASMPSVLGGLIGYGILWTGARGLVLLLGAWFLGANLHWEQAFSALLIVMLIVAAYLPIGMIAAACVVAFRTPGPLPQLVAAGSALLGGVYYPTSVIPSWIEGLANLVPLSYGLRALRGTLLDGQPLSAVMQDTGILALMALVLAMVGTASLLAAFHHARRTGTLAHY